MTVYYQVLRIFWLTGFHCFVIMSLTPCRCGVKSHFLLLVGGYIGEYIGEESLPLFSLFLTLWGNFCGEKPVVCESSAMALQQETSRVCGF